MIGPNLVTSFGGEERRPLPKKTAPIIAELTRAWTLLFGAGVGVDGTRVDPASWPEALRPKPNGVWPNKPVFDFLPQRDVDIGWWPPGISAFGCAPEIASLVHDKAFAVDAARSFLDSRIEQAASASTSFLPTLHRDLIVSLSPSACDVEVVDQIIGTWPAWAQKDWTLKPRMGTSGRGRVRGGVDGAKETRVQRGLERLATIGGAVLEPWLARENDFSAHAFVGREGAFHFIGSLEQITTTPGVCVGLQGVWTDTGARAGHSGDDPLHNTLRDIVAAVAKPATRLGYRGPLGVDSFSFRFEGATYFRPIVEVNARFTMGLITLGIAQRAADVALLHSGDHFSLSLTRGSLDGADFVFDLSTSGDVVNKGTPSGDGPAVGLTFSIVKA